MCVGVVIVTQAGRGRSVSCGKISASCPTAAGMGVVLTGSVSVCRASQVPTVGKVSSGVVDVPAQCCTLAEIYLYLC